MSILTGLVTQQADFERRSEEAWKRSQLTFHSRHEEEWRNALAADLNTVLGRVQYEMETCLPPDEHDVEFAEATLRLIERVAEFEDIQRMVTSARRKK